MALFKPMLAASENVTPDQFASLRYPLYASQKLDGIRCLIINGVACSRKLLPLPNVHIQNWVIRNLIPDGLDGEIIIPGKSFHEIQSWVMTRYTSPSEFEFHVFDKFTNPQWGFNSRLKDFDMLSKSRVYPIHQIKCHGPRFLEDLWSRRDPEGEGLILRDPDAPYKFGRSTRRQQWALKVKRFEDAEAKIIGFEPKMHNDNPMERDNLGNAKRSSHKANQQTLETLGALVCKDCKTGRVFKIGSGFCDNDRDYIWRNRNSVAVKKATVCYKFQPHGVKELPRCPIFKGIRYD
jgi:DNA ligase 1